MQILALDTETSTYNKGNPYDTRNELVCYSYATDSFSTAIPWRHDSCIDVKQLIHDSSLLVGFNFKFDVAWLRKHGVDFYNTKIWDVQIAEFIISCQLNKFPSLNDTCIRYGIPSKLDIVRTEYWEKGIDTKAIPWSILSEYAEHDAVVTLACYHAQLKEMSPIQIKLCKLMSMDMLVLQEMEQNGITYDPALCEERSKQLEIKTEECKSKLTAFYPSVPLNFNSGDDLSSFLYGGTIEQVIKVHDGFYKTGIKKGQPKLKSSIIEHHLPQLFKPVKGSELKKEGYYETNSDALLKLTGPNKAILDTILELAVLEKINGTYYKGLPKLNKEMNWKEGKLHGQFNQTLAISGRLSASRPNQQNFATEIQDIFVSEYN